MVNETNILVVDDEAVIRDGCVKILRKEGWTVDTVENGSECLDLIKSKNFDLILLDLMMPGMNGLEVINELNKLTNDIYIIVITGYATVETAVDAIKSGAYDYIPKPFTPDQLRVVVRKALSNKALVLEAEMLRKEKEKGIQEVAQEKSKIKTILNCMPNGVLVMDKEKRVVLYNPIASKLLNSISEESLGETVDDCVSCSELSDMISDVLIEDQEGVSRMAGEITGKDSKPIMAHVAPVNLEDGIVVGAVTILQDISEQKAIEKMKADFIAKVTHELKAPVATINQLLMTILSGAVGEIEEKQKEMMSRAKQRGDGLIDLISDLLNISKIESGLAIQRKVDLYIKDIIIDVIDLLKPQADEKKIDIKIDFSSGVSVINADNDGMKEVFTNLISNAIKYTENGGAIKIDGKVDKDYVSISVSDNGFGISEKNLPFIFDRFFRVKNSQTRQIIGTGLGLPIVKEIIDAHFGSIKVTSEEGKGSAFTVQLPRG